jgi:hypothetical protein
MPNHHNECVHTAIEKIGEGLSGRMLDAKRILAVMIFPLQVFSKM